MVSLKKWNDNRWSKTNKVKSTKTIIYSAIFWRDIKELLKIYTLLFKLLRTVDTDRKPSMDFVYGMLKDTKKDIKAACNRKETAFRRTINIIEKQSRDRLDNTLYLIAYYLNHSYYYGERKSKTTHLLELHHPLHMCIIS